MEEYLKMTAINDTVVHLGQYLDARNGEFLINSSESMLPEAGVIKTAQFHKINISTCDDYELFGIEQQEKARTF
jgi:hypothetical protein